MQPQIALVLRAVILGAAPERSNVRHLLVHIPRDTHAALRLTGSSFKRKEALLGSFKEMYLVHLTYGKPRCALTERLSLQ